MLSCWDSAPDFELVQCALERHFAAVETRRVAGERDYANFLVGRHGAILTWNCPQRRAEVVADGVGERVELGGRLARVGAPGEGARLSIALPARDGPVRVTPET